jgi:hypothetical protein
VALALSPVAIAGATASFCIHPMHWQMPLPLGARINCNEAHALSESRFLSGSIKEGGDWNPMHVQDAREYPENQKPYWI